MGGRWGVALRGEVGGGMEGETWSGNGGNNEGSGCLWKEVQVRFMESGKLQKALLVLLRRFFSRDITLPFLHIFCFFL